MGQRGETYRACSQALVLGWDADGFPPQATSCGLPQAALEVIQESEAQLWWAAKELRRTKKLSDYVGKNEKTKIIVKIQQVSTSASRVLSTVCVP